MFWGQKVRETGPESLALFAVLFCRLACFRCRAVECEKWQAQKPRCTRPVRAQGCATTITSNPRRVHSLHLLWGLLATEIMRAQFGVFFLSPDFGRRIGFKTRAGPSDAFQDDSETTGRNQFRSLPLRRALPDRPMFSSLLRQPLLLCSFLSLVLLFASLPFLMVV